MNLSFSYFIFFTHPDTLLYLFNRLSENLIICIIVCSLFLTLIGIIIYAYSDQGTREVFLIKGRSGDARDRMKERVLYKIQQQILYNNIKNRDKDIYSFALTNYEGDEDKIVYSDLLELNDRERLYLHSNANLMPAFEFDNTSRSLIDISTGLVAKPSTKLLSDIYTYARSR
jgi:hypothetical protein